MYKVKADVQSAYAMCFGHLFWCITLRSLDNVWEDHLQNCFSVEDLLKYPAFWTMYNYDVALITYFKVRSDADDNVYHL